MPNTATTNTMIEEAAKRIAARAKFTEDQIRDVVALLRGGAAS